MLMESERINKIPNDTTLESTNSEQGSVGSDPPGLFRPAIDIRESPTEFEIFVDLPGIDEDEIDIEWHDTSMIISGSREFNHDTEDAEEFIQLNRALGPFTCKIDFHSPIDGNQATAKYRRGVLKVRIPKFHKEPK